jgi:hypothetical protein
MNDLNVNRSAARFDLDAETWWIETHRTAAGDDIYSSIWSGRRNRRRVAGSLHYCIDQPGESVPFKPLFYETADSILGVLRDVCWNTTVRVTLFSFCQQFNATGAFFPSNTALIRNSALLRLIRQTVMNAPNE